MFAYDRTPLNARIDKQDSSSPEWIRQKISFDAPYGAERVIGVLYLPKGHKPPFQTVVAFPSSLAFGLSSSDLYPDATQDYLLRSGRDQTTTGSPPNDRKALRCGDGRRTQILLPTDLTVRRANRRRGRPTWLGSRLQH